MLLGTLPQLTARKVTRCEFCGPSCPTCSICGRGIDAAERDTNDYPLFTQLLADPAYIVARTRAEGQGDA